MNNINPANINNTKIPFKEKFAEINPFTNPQRCNADALEDYFEDKACILADKITKDAKKREIAEKTIKSINSAVGKSVGELADKAVEKTETAKKAVKKNIKKMHNKKVEEHKGALKYAFSLAGTCIAGGAGIAVAVVVAAIDTFNFAKNVVKQVLVNTLDNLEGTELRKLDDSQLFFKKADRKLKDKSEDIKEEHKILGAVTEVAGSVALTQFAKPVLNLADAGKLVHERMRIRGDKRGVDYNEQMRQTRSGYYATDRKVKDKIKYSAAMIKHNAGKIMDIRAGDVARLAIASLAVVTSVTGILNIFSYVGKIEEIIDGIT